MALRELVDSTHWITVKQSARLVPATYDRVRDWLNRHTLACDRCPVYRVLQRRIHRVLSPRDVRQLRDAMLRRQLRLSPGQPTQPST